MKKLLFIAASLFYLYGSAQIVNIPDPNFKALLLSGNVTSDIDGFTTPLDLNNDNQIQVSEAQAIYGIHLWQNSQYMVSDLTGIAAFSNLEFLSVDYHSITVLDLSGNNRLQRIQLINNPISSINLSTLADLKFLECRGSALTQIDVSNNIQLLALEMNNNQLSSIDVSSNVNLEALYVNNNHLSNIDVSQNPNLKGLTFHNNTLSEIDVSHNLQLKVLYCQNNLLSTVDLSGNPEMDFFDCSYNPMESFNVKNGSSFSIYFDFAGIPNLQSICADAFEMDRVLSKISEYGYTNVSVNAACNSLATADFELGKLSIYPNPATNQVRLENLPSGGKLSIYNPDGKIVYETAIALKSESINLENFASGIYFVHVDHNGTRRTEELVIEGK